MTIERTIIRTCFALSIYALICILVYHLCMPHHPKINIIGILASAIIAGYITFFLETVLNELQKMSASLDFLASFKRAHSLGYYQNLEQLFKQRKEENHENS